MLHNLRRESRYPMAGEVTLLAGDAAITGEVVDISLHGIAVRLEAADEVAFNAYRIWRCHIESPDLPAPVDCMVRVIRRRVWHGGLGVGCEITEIDARPLVLLKAYRTLAGARATPLVWRKKLAV